MWQGDDGTDWEIFYYDGATIQLTNNDYDDFAPYVSGQNVVWYGSDGDDFEIFSYMNASITQLSSNSYDDLYPRISGGNIAWYGGETPAQYEIFLATPVIPEPLSLMLLGSALLGTGIWRRCRT